MEKLLVIDACMRAPEVSRTHRLLDAFVCAYQPAHPGADVRVKTLTGMALHPLFGGGLEEREARMRRGGTDHPSFAEAREFAGADRIVIAAPFWDLGVPSLLKVYIETVCAAGITFSYREDGPHCRAHRLLFLTTRGGVLSEGPDSWRESGARYLKALCAMWRIPDFDCIAAEGLDIDGNDAEALLRDACRRAAALAADF